MNTNDNGAKIDDMKFSVCVTLLAAVVFCSMDLYTGIVSGYYLVNTGFKNVFMMIIRTVAGYAIPTVIALAISFLKEGVSKSGVQSVLNHRYIWTFVATTVLYFLLITFCYINYNMIRSVLIMFLTVAYPFVCMRWFIVKSVFFARDNTGEPV